MFHYLFSMLIASLLFSCEDNREGRLSKFTTNSYIIEYWDVNGFITQVEDNYIKIFPDHMKLGPSYSLIANHDKSSREKYKDIRDSYGDKGFDTTFYYLPAGWPGQYMAQNITAIETILLEDFNSSYQAGASINEILKFYSLTPLPYIKSKYKSGYSWNDSRDYELYKTLFTGTFTKGTYYTFKQEALYPVEGMLNTMKKEDFILIGSGNIRGYECPIFVLELTEEPDNRPIKNMLIKITSSDGQEYEIPLHIN